MVSGILQHFNDDNPNVSQVKTTKTLSKNSTVNTDMVVPKEVSVVLTSVDNQKSKLHSSTSRMSTVQTSKLPKKNDNVKMESTNSNPKPHNKENSSPSPSSSINRKRSNSTDLEDFAAADIIPKKQIKPNNSKSENSQVKIKSVINLNEQIATLKINKYLEIKELKEKNAKLQQEIEKLTKQKESYKKKYVQKENDYISLLKLNQDFQQSVIESNKEKEEMFNRLTEAQQSVQIGYDLPAIGSRRTSGNMKRYHIGRDIWLSENEYTGILNTSKSPSQLAGYIITLVFSVDELLTSTKSGFKSRRSGEGKVKCGKLDEVKLACEEFYKYWMINIYTPVTKKRCKIFYSRDDQISPLRWKKNC
ncbi:uncharacterized protein LOC116417049 [Nasonia vitripennis]|uniref:BEN domain-containing protein n=1 Tax=Nasonia vitripennis TaxID=7425 RepID=A0A7M7QBP2_NASVI|nr:uncharacterized protein LOC116417049 [Nasonia vitripennis]